MNKTEAIMIKDLPDGSEFAKNTYVSQLKNDDLRALARVVEMANESLAPADNTEMHRLAEVMSKTRKKSMGLDCGCDCFFTDPYGFVPQGGCPVHD